MTSKKRKYGDLASQPVNSDPEIFADVFAAFTGRRPPTTAGPATPARDAAPAQHDPEARHDAAPAPHAVPAQNAAQVARPQPDILASLPEVRGYIRLPHQIIDHLLPQLDVYEAHVYLHLYRLSWGFGNPTCTITNPGLARRCNLSERTIRNVTPRLRAKGLIDKVRVMEGSDGIEWKVASPAGAAPDAVAVRGATGAQPADSNRKALKESNKGEVAPPDYKNCPDCQGRGFWYPEGVEKGVAKCKHNRMGSESYGPLPST